MRDTVGTRSHAGLAPTPAARDLLEPGTALGDWRVERVIGHGGMGTVYQAVHSVIGKHAAIKVVHADMTVQTRERFVLEAQVVNQIGHPGIVDIFHIDRLDDGRPYLVMELLRGKNLDDRMADGRLAAAEVIDILLQICAALASAHGHGVVHRDLKPANIVLVDGHDGGVTVKVVDWGIAKLIDSLAAPTASTLSGTLLGTPEHMSPEQARGEPDVDGRTDIYALGSVAYELFLEGPPFAADNVAELLAMQLHDSPVPPRDLWPDIPPKLDRLLRDMLAKSRDDRPSLVSVMSTLHEVGDELAARRPCRTVALPRRRRSLLTLGLSGLALAGLALLVGRVIGAPTSRQPAVRAATADVALAVPEPDHPHTDLAAPVVDLPAAPIATPRRRASDPRPQNKRSAERRRSAPSVDPDGTIDPFQ